MNQPKINTSSEKRKFRRIHACGERPVYVHFPDTGSTEYICVQDISLGGFRIQIPENWSKIQDDSLMIGVIKLPDEKSFIIRAEISNKMAADGLRYFGLKFRNILEHQITQIEQYINGNSGLNPA